MSERRGTKALEVWCKRVTEGYPGVKVENMTTSWRDGLAFCAMIHHFRPDLIDFNSLDKRDVYRNNELAFTIAERHLGIPALLDAEDMVEYEVPDRLSMLTYLSQFYQAFVGQQGNSPNSRTPAKRSSVSPSLSSSPELSPNMSPTSSSPPTKAHAGGAAAVTPRGLRDPCTHCGLPVFLAERLIVGNKRALYHRTCFRCARCCAQLTLANCYETEDGCFCCETCPDEENDRSDCSSFVSDRLEGTSNKRESISSYDEPKPALHRGASRSDDEKSIGVNADEYSESFESALDNEHQRQNRPNSQPEGRAPLAPSQLVTNDLDSKSEDPSLKILPHSLLVHSNVTECDASKDCAQSSQNEGHSPSQVNKSTVFVAKALPFCKTKEFPDSIEPCQSTSGGEVSVTSKDNNVNSKSNIVSVSKHQHVTASTVSGADNCTKDSQISSADHTVSSIVKMRKMLFEGEIQSANSGGNLARRNLSDDIGKSKEKSENCDSSSLQERIIKQSLPLESEETKINMNYDKGIGKDGEAPNVFKQKDNIKIDPFKEINVNENVSKSDDDLQNNLNDEDDVISSSLRPSVSPRKVFLLPKSEFVDSEEHIASTRAHTSNYPSELNPFGDEDNEENETSEPDKQACEKLSTNPFGSDGDEDEDDVVLRRPVGNRPPRPPPPQMVFQDSDHTERNAVSTSSPAHAQTVSLNPFGSDEEETDEPESSAPVPRPRTIWLTPEPIPRTNKTSSVSSALLGSSGQFGSASSLTSMNSSCSTNRRSKKPAPAPPPAPPKSDSVTSSPYSSLRRSPHRRKSRPAPPPPQATMLGNTQPAAVNQSWDKQKIQKDEANRNKQAVDKDDVGVPRDKSTFGQWKRKKGPAPPRPLPQRREVRAMPLKELKRELDDIEVKQQELERQGVKLEQTIRVKFDEAPGLPESSMTPDVEVLVLQLFELVNEKNELFRKQAELMYMRRQHRLEEEHAELEYQIRCLMEQPERNKTDSDKAKEEELIQRLVEVVERRNEIIECLDMDRIREAEEDNSIHAKLGQFTARERIEASGSGTSSEKPKKEKKKKKKEKDSKKKKGLKLDADKDIDEIEAAAIAAAAKEKKTKRKWF